MTEKSTTEVTEQVEPQVKMVKSIKDLPDRSTIVNIEMDDGVLSFPARRLTYKRFQELGRMVSDPEPPVRGVDDLKRPIYNTYDRNYLAAIQQANETRLYYRLAEFLDIELSGEDVASRAKILEEHLEFGLTKALGEAMQQTMLEGKVTVNARAATFQSGGTGGVAHLSA